MTATEYELLENMLDALDRLFDGHCGAVDVRALLVATGAALLGTPYQPVVEQPLAELGEVIRSGAPADAQRDRALFITDPLRHYLAGLLPPIAALELPG